jgi:hypothetical protein
MQRRPASDCVRIARANIRLAAQICGAADMTRLQRALDFLEAAAAGMRRAEAEARSGMPEDPAGLRREIALLKREIAGMMRVIDGCAALHRGLCVRLGCTALTYTPQGRAVAALPSAVACEMQV